MNVYDFDNTIYSGESVIDFYLFCIKKKPKLIRFLPLCLAMLLRYKFGFISLPELEEKATKYIGKIFGELNDISSYVKEFWDKNQKKIKHYYLKQKRPDDIIVSASCDFLLLEILKRIDIKNHIFSQIDLESGKIIKLCYNTNKPQFFKEAFGDVEIENFYTDSVSDTPMIALSKNAYLVKGNKITKIK